MDKGTDGHGIGEIVDSLTSKLYYHGHPINRKEAKNEIKLKTVQDASEALEETMWKLYLDYESEMKSEEPFNTASEFVSQHPNPPPAGGVLTPASLAKLAYIESKARTDVFTMSYQLSGQPQMVMGPTGPISVAGAVQVTLVVSRKGWVTE